MLTNIKHDASVVKVGVRHTLKAIFNSALMPLRLEVGGVLGLSSDDIVVTILSTSSHVLGW